MSAPSEERARFLLDTNVPKGLATWLLARNHEAKHVLDLGIGQGTDLDIWAHAHATGSVVISKDEDFADLVRGRWPAQRWYGCGQEMERRAN